MSYEEFLGQLELLLLDVSADERREALEYYRSYFEDAGKEKEQEVLQEFGSPKDAADFIKKDLRGTAEEKKQYEASKTENHKKQPDHTGRLILVIVILVITAPIWFSIIAAAVSMICSFIIAAIAVTGSGLFTAGYGVIRMFSQIPSGLLLLGAGLLLFVLGLICTVFLIKGCVVFLPKIFNAVICFIRRPIDKKEVQ